MHLTFNLVVQFGDIFSGTKSLSGCTIIKKDVVHHPLSVLSISELTANCQNDDKSILFHSQHNQHMCHAMMFMIIHIKMHVHFATQSITEFNISCSSSFQATKTQLYHV